MLLWYRRCLTRLFYIEGAAVDIQAPEFNERKFRELILLVAEKSENDPHFGAVKLNKLLYYAEFQAFRILGSPIAGATYIHLEEGPVPDGLDLIQISLIDDGSAQLEPRRRFNYIQKRLKALRPADLTEFSAGEIEIINEVIASLRPHNAREVSSLSHEEVGWRVVDYGDPIPYRTAWLSRQPLTTEQVELGKQIAQKHELVG